ncbi:MAG TPA: hypothetical protein VF139_04490 [Candidatus Polarisedimenticolaceae bacterium]
MIVPALLLAAALAQPPAALKDPFGPLYPIDAEASYPAAIFQWLDSLAQTSVGKTIPAHRADYVRRFGRATPEDAAAIERFWKARLAHEQATGSRSDLLGIFCAAPTMEAGMRTAGERLSAERRADLEAALAHFQPKFDQIWSGGSIPRRFLGAMRDDPSTAKLSDLLGRAARFFGADGAALSPKPRLVLVPVPDGWGTHAQAIGRQLLLEIRPGDRLADQAAVIVHENVHFLVEAMPEERRRGLERIAVAHAPHGAEAWAVLREALPTALGQGVADRAFRPREWSRRLPWYDTPEVDAYAKAIYPLVQQAIELGSYFDAEFVRLAVELYPLRPPSRRSP